MPPQTLISLKQIQGRLGNNCSDPLSIQRKAFDLSCRRHERTLMNIECVRKCAGTMPERCAAVLAAKGGQTMTVGAKKKG